MISAGRLKDFVTILAPGGTPDSAGQVNSTFTTLRQCWAEVIQLNGRELMEARQIYAVVSTRVRVRWQDGNDVKASMRIPGDSRVLNVLSVVDVKNTHQMIEMLCEEPR